MWANQWQGGGGWPVQQAHLQAMPHDQGNKLLLVYVYNVFENRSLLYPINL